MKDFNLKHIYVDGGIGASSENDSSIETGDKANDCDETSGLTSIPVLLL